MPRLPLLMFLALAACAAEPSPSKPATPPRPRLVDEAVAAAAILQPLPAPCDLSTPLVPGVPGSPGHLIASPRNPNGDSELSFLMRHFVDDLVAVRGRLQRGEPMSMSIPLLPVHWRIRCSWPTRPDERNAAFDGMAQAYLATVAALDRAPSKTAYAAVVQSCIACHTATCVSVVEAIEQLRWD